MTHHENIWTGLSREPLSQPPAPLLQGARTTPCVTFRRVAVSSRGPGQSPALPLTCCAGSLYSDGCCGLCSCWRRFRVAEPSSRHIAVALVGVVVGVGVGLWFLLPTPLRPPRARKPCFALPLSFAPTPPPVSQTREAAPPSPLPPPPPCPLPIDRQPCLRPTPNPSSTGLTCQWTAQPIGFLRKGQKSVSNLLKLLS